MLINQLFDRSSKSRFTHAQAINLDLLLVFEKSRLRARSIALNLQQQLTQMGLPNADLDDLRDR